MAACTPGVVLAKIWTAAGLPIPTANPADPYALRHHFAFANIERWAADGIDPLTMLPYLARYMGHADISSTYYYLALSPDYTATYAATAHAYQALIPEVSDDQARKGGEPQFWQFLPSRDWLHDYRTRTAG
ncbi:MAG: hypothetical protein R2722_13590 [Tessaracoccus sp.]